MLREEEVDCDVQVVEFHASNAAAVCGFCVIIDADSASEIECDRTSERSLVMRVECNINADCMEPYAVLHIIQMSPAIAEAISILEREGTDSLPLVGVRDGKTYFLEPGDLELIRTEGREVICYDKLKNRYRLDKPLYELERILGEIFVRVSKSSIINIRQISHVSAGFNGSLELVMKNGMEDYISRSFRKSFKERLGLK